MKRAFVVLLFSISVLTSCQEVSDEILTFEMKNVVNEDVLNPKVTINTKRNILNLDTNFFAKAKEFNESKTRAVSQTNPFLFSYVVKSSRSLIPLDRKSHIFLGNVLAKESVITADYASADYTFENITLMTDLPNSTPITIEHPTYSKYVVAKDKSVEDASFEQNSYFNFNIEHFTHYDELKTFFGYDANINGIFFSAKESEQKYSHSILKKTGVVISFVEEDFTASMDYPSINNIDLNSNIDDYVYVSSITYGRMGLLTIETTENYEKAKVQLNKTFNSIFYKKNTSYSKEEESFFNKCHFKLYIVGGSGGLATRSFSGLEGFINYVDKGFVNSKRQRVPIYCAFSNLLDNKNLTAEFEYRIEIDPLYVELTSNKKKYIPEHSSYLQDVYINCYADEFRKESVIPLPFIKFNLENSWGRDLLIETYIKPIDEYDSGFSKTTYIPDEHSFKSLIEYQVDPRYSRQLVKENFIPQKHGQEQITDDREKSERIVDIEWDKYTLLKGRGYQIIGNAEVK